MPENPSKHEFSPKFEFFIFTRVTIASKVRKHQESEIVPGNSIFIPQNPKKSPQPRFFSEFFARQFTTLLKFSSEHRLTRLRLLDLLRHYATDDDVMAGELEILIEENRYWRIRAPAEIDEIVRKSMEKQEKLVEKCRSGHVKSFNRLRNSIIDSSNKCIELEDLEASIRRLL